MQNKGAIRFLAIAFAVVCLYQLTFTYFAKKVEKDAAVFGNGNKDKVNYYLDSISNQPVYPLFGFTYKECKEYEINLGLDLKGGMNVTMEVAVVDIIKALANDSKDEAFVQAINKAREAQKNSQEAFVDLFAKAFKEIAPNELLSKPEIFGRYELQEKITPGITTNADVIKVLKDETEGAISNTFNILRSRIDRFGVAQPNIREADIAGRIIIELPGIKDPNRVRKLLQGTANLEFWETYTRGEISQTLVRIDSKLAQILEAEKPKKEEAKPKAESKDKKEEAKNKTDELLNKLAKDSLAKQIVKSNPFTGLLDGSVGSSAACIGGIHIKDTAKINKYLTMPQIASLIPSDAKFLWGVKPAKDRNKKETELIELFVIKTNGIDSKPPLDGDVIVNARGQYGDSKAEAEVSMKMNGEGSRTWARLTRENVNRPIAIVLDNLVYSAPNVLGEIKGGSSSITGGFSIKEAKDLANILKSGKLPAPARIVSEEVVGPTLGKESVRAGFISFAIAFGLILVYMLFFYSKGAGSAAILALVANLFFIMGVLASLGAVLTLPGIAGIVLTIGMAVDANVLIYERIAEELKAGKGIRLAVKDGYANAYSAIIDGNITTFLTGVILYVFGEGPIKGFATTLMLGIITSLCCAILLTRLMFARSLRKDRNITFTSKATKNWLTNTNIKFLEKRKAFYVISSLLIVASLFSLFTKGLNQSIDFVGGRSYVVDYAAYTNDANEKGALVINTQDLASELGKQFGHAPEVVTFGNTHQVKITTKYKIQDEAETVDTEVEDLLFKGSKKFLKDNVTKKDFLENYRTMSSKVGPSIADDIKQAAVWAIIFALIVIFLYIMIRFRNWRYGLGAVAALAHDTIIVLGIFSMFYGILPFSLEIDQAFIAAILTVVGYSINDTVVVFDRIREYLNLHPKQNKVEVIDKALNSTLRRTFSTSLSTLVVLLAIFIFGGASIQGFTFALLVGVVVGTYSSLFIATPVSFDSNKKMRQDIKK